MGELVQLFFHCGHHFRMTMAGIQYRDPGGEINIVIAFHVGKRGILRRAGKEITHYAYAARGGRKSALMKFPGYSCQIPFVEMIKRQDDRAGCNTPRPSP